MSESVAVLSEAQLARLADLLAPRIADALRAPAEVELLDAGEVARRFGVTAEWVRDHRDELGAISLGDGPRPRLRFDVQHVAATLTRRSESGRSLDADPPVPKGDRPPTSHGRSGNALDTLPVRQVKSSLTTKKAARRHVNAPGPATRDTASTRKQRTSAATDRP